MEEPIQLTTFGKPKLNNASTDATPNGISAAPPTTKVDIETNNNLIDQQKNDTQGVAVETKESNSLIQETVIDVPEPPPPPPIQVQTTCTVATEATADIIDSETPTTKGEESISPSTAKPVEQPQAIAPAVASSPGNVVINSVPREKELSSTPIKLSTFSPPLSVISEAPLSESPDVQDTKKDETPKPAEDPTAPSTGDPSFTSLSNQADAKPGTDPSQTSPESDEPARTENVVAVAVLDLPGTELGLAEDDQGPKPVVLTDEAVESNSVASGMKLASFDTELQTMFVKDADQEQRSSRVRFIVLCTMAVATVMLIFVVVGLVLLMTYDDISKILAGKGGRPRTVTKQSVMMEGECRIEELQFSPSYKDRDSKVFTTLQRQFKESIDDIFDGSDHSEIYRLTTVSKFRKGSVVVFSVDLKPMEKPLPFEDPTPGRKPYQEAKNFLKMELRTVTINSKAYNVSVIKLNLKFGIELVTEEPPTTTIHFTMSHVTTARDQMSATTNPTVRMADGYQSTRMSATAGPGDMEMTTKASTSAAPMSTSGATTASASVTVSDQTAMSMTQEMTAEASTTNAVPMNTSDAMTASVTDMIQTTMYWNETLTTQNQTNASTPAGRQKRSTRFTDMPTTRLITKQSSGTLPVSLTTTWTEDDVTEGCFPHPYKQCELFGMSLDVTRTPNRFGIEPNTSQIWDQFTNQVTEGTVARHPTSWQVICSLLAPSCDGRLIGRTLPCRSACLAFVGALRETVETRALGALCSETLPESESEAICFKYPNNDPTHTPPTGGSCSALQCRNGGTCFDMNNRTYCRCPEGYGGYNCEVDPCSPNPCLNGATCQGHAEFIISYACGCIEGYHGAHCELSTTQPLPAITPNVDLPVEIDEPGCRDLLPYNKSLSGAKVPDWQVVAPLASCSDDARFMFCLLAYPEYRPRDDEGSTASRPRRAPCRPLCERVIAECGAFFTVIGRDFPGDCAMLGTIPTEVENVCTDQPHP